MTRDVNDDIKAVRCQMFCDFGYRGMDRCNMCDGTGSQLVIPDGRLFPNTEDGYREAVQAMAEEISEVSEPGFGSDKIAALSRGEACKAIFYPEDGKGFDEDTLMEEIRLAKYRAEGVIEGDIVITNVKFVQIDGVWCAVATFTPVLYDWRRRNLSLFPHNMPDDEIFEHFRSQDYVSKLPSFSFPSNWNVTLIPPFGGAAIRFKVVVQGREDFCFSVYLDLADKLGYYGAPYWEVYPNCHGDIGRFPMKDTKGLINSIEETIRKNPRYVTSQQDPM